jgi:hypothetical protein
VKHPTTHRGCQVFQFMTRAWCITKALELIEADPIAAELVEAMDITTLDSYLELTPATPGMVRLITMEVDKEYALTRTNLEKPILVVRLTSDDGEDYGSLVIDGWHRVYRARVEGRGELPAYVLSAEAEAALRVWVW